MPGAMFIVDTRREHIAVKEAKKLGVTTVALIDTDSDPDLIDLPIPGNDDAMRAVEIILHELADAIIEGKTGRPRGQGRRRRRQQPPRRRSARASFRADDGRGGAAGRRARPPRHQRRAPARRPGRAGPGARRSPSRRRPSRPQPYFNTIRGEACLALSIQSDVRRRHQVHRRLARASQPGTSSTSSHGQITENQTWRRSPRNSSTNSGPRPARA